MAPSPIRAVQADPLDARLAELFRRHVAFVVRVLRRLGLDAAAAEDGAQEVFLVVHRRLEQFDARGSTRAWLFAIARRVAAHHHRGTGRRDARLRRVPPPGDGEDPEQQAARGELLALAGTCLATLDDPHRLVFELAELEGMTAPEIATALELPLNTVYSRLRNARRKFERELQRHLARPGGSNDGSQPT